MATRTYCPACGVPLPADAPAQICPKCLLKKGMESTAGFEAGVPEMLSAGERFGPYSIVRLLGKGGMGAVYEAEHIESGRRIALKVLNHKLESLEHRQRFLREGRLAAAVSHPNSVYIYGTEEIAGIPVIAMELAAGGTLEQRVKRSGPLSPGEAVDVVLDIIAGLEAAEAAGVLHRDVKPSNCFVDSDGNVKIGDFGLSISTTLRGDTNLTQSGVFLGTPAFSSPEQLRGDELDVRSDIYSVGVTLYYLLTGKPPFEAKQMVQLLATVLERPAPSLRARRPEISAGLAKVVQRCLAKQSADRYRGYHDLRQALWAYRSAAPTPGTVGFRVLANGVDHLVLWSVAALLPLFWSRDLATWQLHSDAIAAVGPQRTVQLNLLSGLGGVLFLLYFGLLEGIWGKSAGKAICRLRVVGADREAPGIPRAGLRVLVFAAVSWAPWWIVYVVDREFAVQVFAADVDSWSAFAVGLACTFLFLLLFVTMRRRNGFAGLHELASRTRVVRAPALQIRPALELEDEPLADGDLRVAERIGPYDVLGPLDATPDREWLLAYDTRLLRKVWIIRCPGDIPPLPTQMRELSRTGRLRWLNGHRGPDEGWDAYEAPSGRPLTELISEPQPWDAVRFWLLDLAREIHAARHDGTLPKVLGLDRIWITADGRAKLLDFPAPGHADGATGTEGQPESATGPAIFLKQTAIAALEGRPLPSEEAAASSVASRLPLSAREVLNKLPGQTTPDRLVAEFESLVQRPAAVSPQRRAAAFAACWIFPVLMAFYLLAFTITEKRFLRERPEVGELAGYVAFYEMLREQRTDPAAANLRGALEVVIAHRFREIIEDDSIWMDPAVSGFLSANDRELLRSFVERHPSPSPKDVADAERQIDGFSRSIWSLGWSTDDYPYSGSPVLISIGVVATILALGVILPSLICAVTLGSTPLLRILEIAVVNRAGAPASRLRVFCRNAILWSLVLACLGLLFLAARSSSLFASALAIYLIGLLFLKERGFHERIAGTWLAPR